MALCDKVLGSVRQVLAKFRDFSGK
jgi:hypothetical protein